MNKEFKKILENLDRGIAPNVNERQKLWEIYNFLNSLPSNESQSVSDNETKGKNKSLEDEDNEILNMTNVPRDLLNKPFTI